MAASPGLARTQPDKMGTFLRAFRRVVVHWRAIILLLILACVAFLVARSDEFVSFELIGLALLLIFIASQLFWIGRILDLGERFIPGKPHRAWLAIMAGLVYSFVFLYSYPEWGLGHIIRAADHRPQSMLIYAAFWWWFVGSLSAFLLVIAFGVADRAARAPGWAYRKVRTAIHRHSAAADAEAALLSPGRRCFLERTAVLVSATPFVAASYGLLYGRHDVEVVRQRTRLARLPKAFEGFHIAQLSDIHIGLFTTADYIRRCVAITNGLKPDLVALTGDYICWDPEAQGEVVRVLAGPRAPHGVFGCLGNHEADVGIEESITRLFAAQGIRILRQERAPIRLCDDTLNLIGIDDGGDVAPMHTREVERYRRLQQLRVGAALVAGPLMAGLDALVPETMVADSAAASGLGDLTVGEVNQIQNVVNQAGRPLHVVGSAASGTRTAASDIDYLVSPSSLGYFNDLEAQLPGIDPIHGIIWGFPDPALGPSIPFSPQCPTFP